MRSVSPSRPTRTRAARRLFALPFVLLLAGALPAFGQAIKVSSAVPDATEQGTVGQVVRVGGENFGSKSQVAFYVTGTTNPGGIAVKNVKFIDAKNLDVTLDVAPDAQTTLKFDIVVKVGGRTGKGTELFTVLRKTPPDPAIAYIAPGTRDRLMVCDEDGSHQTALVTGSRQTNLGWPRTHPGDPLDPSSGSVAFLESERFGWGAQVKRVRFHVDASAVVVDGVDVLASSDASTGPTPPVAFSPDGNWLVFLRGGYGAGVPDRVVAVSTDGPTPVETTICTGPDWGAGWPDPGCPESWPAQDWWPEWVFDASYGFTPDGKILLQQTNWIPDPRACTSYTPLLRLVEIDGDPSSWTGGPCVVTPIYGPVELGPEGELESIWRAEIAHGNHELALEATRGGVSGIYRLDYVTGVVSFVAGTEGGLDPSWSCDDGRLAIGRMTSGPNSVQLVDLGTGTISTIVNQGSAPSWGRCP